MPIDPRSIGPVALDGDKRKAFLSDQRARDALAHAVELRCAVCGFAQQHDTRIANALQQRLQLGRIHRVESFGHRCHLARQRCIGGSGLFAIRRSDRHAPHGAGVHAHVRRLTQHQVSPDVGHVLNAELVVRQARHPHQLPDLGVATQGHDESAALCQLVFQHLRNVPGIGMHHDRIEWRIFRPAFGPAVVAHMHVVAAQAGECGHGRQRGRPLWFDAVHARAQARQQRRHISRASPDLQHFVLRLEAQRGEHHAHVTWTRQQQTTGDGQRHIVKREFQQNLGREFLARYLAHGVEHPFGTHIAAHHMPFHHDSPALEKFSVIHVFVS